MAEAAAAAKAASTCREPPAARTTASTEPSFARWASAQWIGKNLAQVGIELKVHLPAQPGWLGDFCRASRCVASPMAEAASGRGPVQLLPLPIVFDAVEEREWSCRQRGKHIPDLGEKSDKVLERAAGIRSWTWCVVAALNFVHGGRGATAARHEAEEEG